MQKYFFYQIDPLSRVYVHFKIVSNIYFFAFILDLYPILHYRLKVWGWYVFLIYVFERSLVLTIAAFILIINTVLL